MTSDVLYMLGIVAAGFAVNFALRALPFVCFGGGRTSLSPRLQHLCNYISPVIIAGLIVYSFSGLAWRTGWPYLAGVLTVGLHLWRRNPLASIVAGTLLYMLLVGCCGCATRGAIELDADHPSVRMTTHGVMFGEESVLPQEVPEILSDYDVPNDRVIYILLEDDVKDLGPARTLMGYLGKAGYTRSVLVTKRHAESINVGKRKPTAAGAVVPKRTGARRIRYRKAGEE